MAKGRDVNRPKRKSDWKLVHADNASEKGWRDLCGTQAGNCKTLYDRLEADPTATDNINKQHPLKGNLATVEINGKKLPQWQYELANGARVWYAVDDHLRTVHLTRCSTRHPNETK